MKYFATLSLLLVTLFIACKSDSAKPKAEDAKEEVKTTKYTITPFSPSQAYPDATLSNMQYKDGSFNFDVSGSEYKLGAQTPDAGAKMCANSAKGQHIHLIVDNAPYAAKYVNNFKYDVADGDHTILAFLSRSYHESLKTDNAHILQNVTVKDKAIVSQSDVTSPTITYSRPKGKYVGDDTKKVMLDFYLSNVDLNDGYSVNASINGEDHTITTWQPYYIEGMPMGKNKITLTLMKEGKAVDTPLNPVTREFELLSDPAPASN
ncbi:MAG: hypothetical protein HKO66_03580 [Saprospiraceae bacterium]|nr:hypothetical protein [Bacteroidia bacterium]NNL91295.1 hypothetical protein [Saprospiraceae bacterium]